jgi:hypothetical protein
MSETLSESEAAKAIAAYTGKPCRSWCVEVASDPAVDETYVVRWWMRGKSDRTAVSDFVFKYNNGWGVFEEVEFASWPPACE